MNPDYETFKSAVNKYRGNLSNVADSFGVSRTTVYNWCKEDERFMQALNDSRKRLFDNSLSTAEVVALGIPDRDEQGRVIGWRVAPDGQMLRYLISKLGKDEGFGDNMDITTNGREIAQPIMFSPTPLTEKDIQEIKDIQDGTKSPDDTGISET